MIEVIPAIIAHSYEELDQKLKAVESFVEKVQVDIMDGKFVADTTIGLEEIEKINTNLQIQAHLMVMKPEKILNYWVSSPVISELIFHIEAADHHIYKIIDMCLGKGRKVGIAINPGTETIKLYPTIGKIDFVQFMTVYPGKYGSDFVESVLGKISAFHSQYPNVKIIVDGAMHVETARKAVAAGASAIVAGSHIFAEGRDISEAIEELKSSA